MRPISWQITPESFASGEGGVRGGVSFGWSGSGVFEVGTELRSSIVVRDGGFCSRCFKNNWEAFTAHRLIPKSLGPLRGHATVLIIPRLTIILGAVCVLQVCIGGYRG